MSDADAMLKAPRGVFTHTEEKESCKNDTAFLTITQLGSDALKEYIANVRPWLARACQPKGSIVEVEESDLVHIDSMVRLSTAEFQDYKDVDVARNPDKWTIIFEKAAPRGGWKTKNLTPELMKRAWRASDFNTALFLDHNGKPIEAFGYAFAPSH